MEKEKPQKVIGGNMSIRSKWTDVTKEERKKILIRDNKQCIYCGNKKTLTMAHIFLSRSKGGKGCMKNIATLCSNCHLYTLDNPIGDKKCQKSKEILQFCKNYLIEKENIKDIKELIESLKYKKEITPFEIKIEKVNRCKNCMYLIKKKGYNTSVSNYYCKYRKISLSKNTRACKNFKNCQID